MRLNFRHTRLLFALGLSAVIVGLTLLVVAPDYVRVQAQNRMSFSRVAPDGGHIGLGLALRKLSVSGTFMQCPAHPDDETNAVLAAPKLKAQLADFGATVMTGSPADFGAFITAEIEKWGKVVKFAGMRPE